MFKNRQTKDNFVRMSIALKENILLHKAALIIVAAFLLADISHAKGDTITVGPSTGCDFQTVQEAIDAAEDGDTVLVAPDEYVITEPVTFRGKAITVKSEAGPDETAIRMGTPTDPKRASVVIFENNETEASILEGFTITGGNGSWVSSESAYAGGGIYFDASSGTIRNCAIVQNRAEKVGGGVLVYSGSSAILTNCIIGENSSKDGGGIFSWENASVTMTDCIIGGNSATGVTVFVNGYGGGLYCGMRCLLTAINCNIAENSAGVGGGGIMCYQNSSATLTDCVVMENSARVIGGGIECTDGSVTLTNCTIARNSTLNWGGGLSCHAAGSSVTFSNCSIWGNSAEQEGGGVGCFNGASATVTNSIFLGNTAARGNEIFLEQAPTEFSLSYSNVAGGQAGIHIQGGSTLDWNVGNIEADPLFADPNNGDFHLKSQAGRWNPNSQSWVQDDVTSPCIDAGDPMSPIGLEPFPSGGFVNMGAYGGMPEASKAYFGELVCETIMAGDINGDGQVNRADLEIMALHWTDDVPLALP